MANIYAKKEARCINLFLVKRVDAILLAKASGPLRIHESCGYERRAFARAAQS